MVKEQAGFVHLELQKDKAEHFTAQHVHVSPNSCKPGCKVRFNKTLRPELSSGQVAGCASSLPLSVSNHLGPGSLSSGAR